MLRTNAADPRYHLNYPPAEDPSRSEKRFPVNAGNTAHLLTGKTGVQPAAHGCSFARPPYRASTDLCSLRPCSGVLFPIPAFIPAYFTAGLKNCQAPAAARKKPPISRVFIVKKIQQTLKFALYFLRKLCNNTLRFSTDDRYRVSSAFWETGLGLRVSVIFREGNSF